MPEFTAQSADGNVRIQGTVTYRCADCQELIPDYLTMFVDAPSGYVGTKPPVPMTKTVRTYHLAHIPE